MKPKPTDPSRLRQQLQSTERQRAVHLETLLGERGPLIGGSFVAQPGRCGKPTCKCARGEFHDSGALYTHRQGRKVCLYVPLDERPRVEQLSRRYQQFRRARATLAKLGRHSLELADALQEALSEPYPPQQTPRRAAKGHRRPRS